MTNNITAMDVSDLEYVKGRLVMYGEMPTKTQLLKFIFDVETKLAELEAKTAIDYCYDCGGPLEDA